MNITDEEWEELANIPDLTKVQTFEKVGEFEPAKEWNTKQNFISQSKNDQLFKTYMSLISKLLSYSQKLEPLERIEFLKYFEL